ncbi:LacI family DNA-binding transcriptional regulator [Bosea sp. BK604]|uniref:LacI family DNA-binding transcriptional regulator n=1 Tax=Bosea sp. BK604 TaxID=2512180 RepID=UPI001404BEA4|nr:LacI family DNA-binding transcriptional regulator [Bosea sp. BK604]
MAGKARQSIRSGAAVPERGVSIRAVAERAQVSIATVSRVVNGVANMASPETVARVRAAIADLGYRPSSAGRSLRQRQSRLVAVIAANLGNPAMTAIAASVEVALRTRGLVLALCDSHDRAELQDEYLLEMRAHLVRATVLLGVVKSPQLDMMREAGEPLIFVNRRCPGDDGQPFIGIDNRQAGRDAASFFLRRGVRDIAVIHGHLDSSATVERIGGIAESFVAAGAPLPPERFLTTAGAEHLEIGYRAAGALLEAGTLPAGFACASDMIAFGAHRRLVEAGLEAGGTPHLLGFDDNPLNPWIAPWLSSIRIPYPAYGEALLTMMDPDAPREVILRHEVIDRSVA